MKVQLHGLETDTIFRHEGKTYKKGVWGKGFGEEGETACHPKLGGKFQTGQIFQVWFKNSQEVEVDEN